MLSPRQSGYILPQDFTVVSSVFEKVAIARAISRESDEAERLARYALELYMTGTRDELDLEARLKEFCDPIDYGIAAGGGTTVGDLLPDLSAWARALTASPSAATKRSDV